MKAEIEPPDLRRNQSSLVKALSEIPYKICKYVPSLRNKNELYESPKRVKIELRRHRALVNNLQGSHRNYQNQKNDAPRYF